MDCNGRSIKGFVGYKYPTYKFGIRKRQSENFSDGLFFISLYFITLSFKVFNTLFTVLILISTSSN